VVLSFPENDHGSDNPEEYLNLEDVIETHYAESLVYVDDFHDACIMKLYNTLSRHVGRNNLPAQNVLILHTRNRMKATANEKCKMEYLSVPSNLDPIYVGMQDPTNDNDAEVKTISIPVPQRRPKSSRGERQSPRESPTRSPPKSASHVTSRNPGHFSVARENHVPTRMTTSLTIPRPQGPGGRSEPELMSPGLKQRCLEKNPSSGDEFPLPEKQTSYMVYKNNGSTPEVIHWPVQDELNTVPDFEEDDSDTQIKIDVGLGDFDWRSDSSFSDL